MFIKYIVWSYDNEESQVFVDIVKARTSKEAESRVVRKRPYAILAAYCASMPLADHIRALERELVTR